MTWAMEEDESLVIHDLEEHLRAVGEPQALLLGVLGMQIWGRMAGHDLGKYSLSFQSYISRGNEKAA